VQRQRRGRVGCKIESSQRGRHNWWFLKRKTFLYMVVGHYFSFLSVGLKLFDFIWFYSAGSLRRRDISDLWILAETQAYHYVYRTKIPTLDVLDNWWTAQMLIFVVGISNYPSICTITIQLIHTFGWNKNKTRTRSSCSNVYFY